jgi:ABC-type oligopeptide transport system substrate-binding subunit
VIPPRIARLLPLPLALAIACAPGDRPGERAAGHALQYFGDTTPPAGEVFRYNNAAEPETWDPGLATGQPDGRVARTIFEGLTVPDPRTLEPLPGQAYRWEISADGLRYVFHLRPHLIWSDGTPVTAHDFAWSWLRVLRPSTASRYASLLYPIEGAEAFNQDSLKDESRVGISAPDDSTFVVRLHNPTPYFLFLTNFYTYCPVPRRVFEKYGNRWTRPENVVVNGPFLLHRWRQGDHFEFRKNPRYWDAAHVRLDRIVAYSVEDQNTSVNLYKAGVIDWTTSGAIPSQFIPYLRKYSDFMHGRYHGTYFYSINVTRKPLDNVWVRRALNLAVDRDAIANDLLKRSRDPWGNFAPSGYPGYTPPPPLVYDPEKARDCMRRAGYPDGKGFPKIAILFNTSEDHRRIAEAIQSMWKRVLHIDVELSNQEWGSYLQATTSLQYDVARRSWIGDYLDPTTFLELGATGDGNNRTGWGDPKYDGLLRQASVTVDPVARMNILRDAEALLLRDGPFIPIYHYSINDMAKPYVRGLYQTVLDTHPLKTVWIDHDWRHHVEPLAEADDAEESAAAGSRDEAAAMRRYAKTTSPPSGAH